MTPLLLDAGVWLSSLDPRDEHHVDAGRLIASAERGQSLAALDLTFYEVANVAVRAWKDRAHAETLVALVRDCCPGTIARVDVLAERAIDLAERHELSVYDAAYVAAAEINGWTLVSVDLRDLVRPGLAITPADAAAN